jgi:hypothetical protein
VSHATARFLARPNRFLLFWRNQSLHLLAGTLADLADLCPLLLRRERSVGANRSNLRFGCALDASPLRDRRPWNTRFLPARLLPDSLAGSRCRRWRCGLGRQGWRSQGDKN